MYRDWSLRFAEWATVYPYERGGVLHGLLLVRGFIQYDAHHFCRGDQMPDEIDFTLNFCLHILRSFGFTEFNAYLSTRPDGKAAGDPILWRDAEAEGTRGSQTDPSPSARGCRNRSRASRRMSR